MLSDLRHALHRLRRQPTFALTIVIVLALASGAVAAVLAVADAVVLRPLPYRDTNRLSVIWEIDPRERHVVEVSHRNYVDWREQAKSFESLASFGSVNWNKHLTGHGEPMQVAAAGVSASLFDVLGVPPHAGRVLRPDDDRPKAALVAVISYGLWQRLFGGDIRAVGRVLHLDGKSFEIVGIMPREFDFPKGAELWTAVTPEIDAASAGIKTDALEARWFGVLFAIGRLRSGVTFDQARKELDALNADIDRRTGARPPHVIVITPFEERMLGRTRPALLLLLGAVALIILIACANVATLLLMRASRMQAETAVRLSLGAASRHIYRIWLADGVLLFLIAAGAGLVLAELTLPLIVRLAPESVYRIGDSRLTVPIALLVIALMAAAALATAALVTALTLLRVRLVDALCESGSTATSSRIRGVRRLLVTAEVAVACVLLVGAGLTIRSFVNLQALELGFVPENVLTVDIQPSDRSAKDPNRFFYAPLFDRLDSLPDVIAAGGVLLRPLAFEAVGTDSFALSDDHSVSDTPAWFKFGVPVNKEAATPGYFKALGIALRDGRYFNEGDNERAPLVAIVSESTAKRLFPGRRAVGRRVAAGGDTLGPDGNLPWRTIVGVVSDVRYRGLQDLRFDYYLPYLQSDDRVQHVVIRARGNPLQVIAQVKHEVRQLDPLALVDGITTMQALVDRAVAPWRMNMVLFAVLGTLALAMATVGVYGVVQYAVVERWHELGIRAALGASVRDLRRLIVTEGAVLAVVGIAAGVLAGMATARLMASILFEVAPGDAVTFALAAGMLAVVALLASYLPARLASRADPSLLLRAR